MRENGSVPSDEFDTIVDRALRALRLKPAAVEHGASWSMVGIADTSTRELGFPDTRRSDRVRNTAPPPTGGSKVVAIQTGRTITVWNVGPETHFGRVIAVILGVWFAAFLAEQFMRRLRKPAAASIP